MKRFEKLILGLVFLVSVIFQIHNISLYNPDFGFDGQDHQAYISWIATNHKLPLPSFGWEYTQNPLYYLIGAALKTISINPQFINLIAFVIIGLVIYKNSKSFIASLAFLGLPMANYLIPQVSNELMSGMWIVLCLFLILKIPKIKDTKKYSKQILISAIIIAVGFYTKYTALSLLPILFLSIFLNPRFSLSQKIKNAIIPGVLILLLISPILVRNYRLGGKLFLLATDFTVMGGEGSPRNLIFFIRLDWVPKADIYGARNYSFLGGLWNTFWHDGEHSTTPVVTFHKKAFGLWILGFPLFIMYLIGLFRIFKNDKSSGILLFSYLVIAIASLVQYSIFLPYNFVLKSFYAFGLIVPYTLGLSAFSKMGKRQYWLTISILLIQFTLMVSYFWIQPWWHVVK